MDNVAAAVFLAVFVKAALDRVADIVRASAGKPDLAMPWLAAVALVVGGGVSYLLGLNVFGVIDNELVGRVLTAIAVGGGVEFLNSMLAQAQNRAGADGVRFISNGRYLSDDNRLRVRGW